MGWLLPEHEGYEGDGDDQHVEQVEAAPAEGVFMQDEPVGDDLQDQLDGEDGGEEVVKIVEDLQKEEFLSKISNDFNLHCSSAIAS